MNNRVTENVDKKKNRIPSFFQDLNSIKGVQTAIDRSHIARFTVSKAAIQRAIDEKNVAQLRNYSQYFFHASGEYRRLVEYFAKILTFDYVVVPVVDDKSVSTPRYEKAFQTILNYSNKAHIQETGRLIAHTVIKDGAFFGYERELGDNYVLQQLPTSYCRSRFKIDGNYAVEFDFSFFDLYRTEEEKAQAFAAFPPEFQKMYTAYLGDRQLYRWQLLDSTFSRAHMLTDEVPMLSALFIDLMDMADFKEIEKQRAAGMVDQIVVQEIPIDEDGNLTMELDEIRTIHENAKGMLAGTTKRVLTTPAKMSTLDFKDSKTVAQDDVENAMKVVYASAGTPMILFSSGAKSGSVGLERSIEVDEALMLEILDQFQRWYETRFRSLVANNKKFSFDIIFPPVTIFNRKKMFEMYQAGATLGFPTKLLSMAALGINQSEMSALLNYENNILKLHETMIPVSSSHTQAGVNDEGGRPESEDPLSDEGQKTKDQGKNKNRAEGGA